MCDVHAIRLLRVTALYHRVLKCCCCGWQIRLCGIVRVQKKKAMLKKASSISGFCNQPQAECHEQELHVTSKLGNKHCCGIKFPADDSLQ